MTVIDHPPPSALPSRAAGLPSAAAAMRDLLYRVDSSSTTLWGGAGLRLALFCNQEIFLPMCAANLAALGAVVLAGAPAEAAAALVAAASTVGHYTLFWWVAPTELVSAKGLTVAERAPWAALKLGIPIVAHARAAGGVVTVRPVLPLDVAFVWACARMELAAYEADCVARFGTALRVGGGGGTASAAALDLGNATEAATVTARLWWVLFATATRAVEVPARLLPGPPGRALVGPCRRRAVRPGHATCLTWYLWASVTLSPLVSGLVGGIGAGGPSPRAVAAPPKGSPFSAVAALTTVAVSKRLFTGALTAPAGATAAAMANLTDWYVRLLRLAATPAGAATFLVPTPGMDLV